MYLTFTKCLTSGPMPQSSSQDSCISPVTTMVIGSSLTEKVSSYLQTDGGYTQSELFQGLPSPIKLLVIKYVT